MRWILGWLAFTAATSAAVPPPDEILSRARARPGRVGRLAEKDCRKLTGWKGAIVDGSCSARAAGGGRAAVVALQTECGGDSCSTETWIFAGAGRRVHLPYSSGGTVEVIPERDEVVMDRISPVDDGGAGWEVDLVRLPLQQEPSQTRTRTRRRFARCMSPTLSPGGKWIVCRNRRGDVLRVPVAGGITPELVRRVPGTEEFVPYALIYPSAVWFDSPTSMRAPRSQRADLRLPWNE